MGRRVIAILGGSFNPITNGHISLACQALLANVCHEVWLLPCGDGRTDKYVSAPAVYRTEMCRAALEDLGLVGDDSPVRVCELEVRHGFMSTVKLFRRLRGENADCDFALLIGADLLSELWTWRGDGSVLDEVDFIVVPRGGDRSNGDRSNGAVSGDLFAPSGQCKCNIARESLPAEQERCPKRWRCLRCAFPKDLSFMESNFSSTEVRRRVAYEAVKAGGDTEELELGLRSALGGIVPPSVLSLIVRMDLYQADSSAPTPRQ